MTPCTWHPCSFSLLGCSNGKGGAKFSLGAEIFAVERT